MAPPQGPGPAPSTDAEPSPAPTMAAGGGAAHPHPPAPALAAAADPADAARARRGDRDVHAVPPDLVALADRHQAVQVFRARYDNEGVYFYQAFKDEIADWALEHGRFGGQHFGTARMTWVKPSFGWMLYRSGYGQKPGQNRVLRVKLPHQAVAELLGRCSLVLTDADEQKPKAPKPKRSSERAAAADDQPSEAADGPEASAYAAAACTGAGSGRVQWDPERDLRLPDPGGREPRRMQRTRAIQIGLSGAVSEFYVSQIIAIEDVTQLARAVGAAHTGRGVGSKKGSSKRAWKEQDVRTAMAEMEEAGMLPDERPYMPECTEAVLQKLAMLPGSAADAMGRVGRGKAAG